MNNSINFQKRHEYFNNIYDPLHPSYNKETRIYTKPQHNFDFYFNNNQLSYTKYRDLDFNKQSLENFKSFDKDDLDYNNLDINGKISFNLTNNLVPVKIEILNL